MEKKKLDRLKQHLLLLFVAVSVLLISAVWVEGLVGTRAKKPDYIRDSYQIDPAVYVTLTAEAEEWNAILTLTPEALRSPADAGDEHDQHQGQGGRGQGAGQAGKTPTPPPTGTGTP